MINGHVMTHGEDEFYFICIGQLSFQKIWQYMCPCCIKQEKKNYRVADLLILVLVYASNTQKRYAKTRAKTSVHPKRPKMLHRETLPRTVRNSYPTIKVGSLSVEVLQLFSPWALLLSKITSLNCFKFGLNCCLKTHKSNAMVNCRTITLNLDSFWKNICLS